MPVAVVNLDKGTMMDGKNVSYGKDIVDKLKGNKNIGWKFVTNIDEANEGLDGKKYYAMFVIPENFSSKVLSAKDSKPEQANILYSANEKKNFLAAQINGKVLGELKAEITKTISKEYTKVTFDSLYDVKDGMQKAADGSLQLKDGIATLNGKIPELSDGVTKIDDGANKLNDGVNKLNSGLGDAKNGASALNGGIAQLSGKIPVMGKGVSDLYSGSRDLATGAQKVSAGADGVAAGVNKLLEGSAKSQAAIQQAVIAYMGNHDVSKLIGTLSAVQAQSATPDNLALIKQLKDGAQAVSGGAKGIADGSAKLNVGLAQLNENIPALTTGVTQLNTGSATLVNGLGKLYDGSTQLKDGSTQLKDGTGALKGKIPELASGTLKLADGSKELNDKLVEGSTKINKSLVNDSKTMAEFVSEPINMDQKPIHPVATYGAGFAAYFLALSLWIGALMMFFVITDEVDDDINASPGSIVLGKFLSYGYIGIAQAVLASGVVMLLGLKPNNVPLYFALNILMSLVSIAIIQCLVFLMGQVGRILAIILLLLQLTACAGTFPLELVPNFFKVLNPLMPFTYYTLGLREAISGCNYAVYSKNVTVLVLVGVVFIIISVLMKGHADKLQKMMKDKKEAASIA
jgi:putative membrane protein